MAGVKQLVAWFFDGANRALNSRDKTVDFSDGGEPNQQVFENMLKTTLLKKVDINNFQDQATYTQINSKTTPDKFVTPLNLPQTIELSGNPIKVAAIAAPNEGNPYITYRISADKATYGDVLAGNSDTILTPDNYPIVSASLDADNVATVTPQQNGNAVEYVVKVANLPLSSLIINTTYTNLVAAIGASTLKPGFWYKFSYQCIHQIPYTNVLNTSSTLTIPTEDLLVQAISSNMLDRTNVRSIQHPQDIIHWRYEDNKVVTPTNEDPLFTQLYIDTVNDGITNTATFSKGAVSYVVPQVDRPGRIYYREDTIQRISTPYDFRGVVLRRWALKKNGSGSYIFKNALTFTPSTLYKHHNIILDSGTYYIVIYPFTSTSTFSDNFSNIRSLTQIVSSSAGATPQYIATNPTAYIFYDTDNQYFTSTKVEADVDNTLFQDQFTFYNSSNTLQAYNVHIKNYIPAWIEAVTWEFYPNIVFATHLGGGITPITNVSIDKFSYDLTLYNVTSLEIGNYCRDIFINGRANGNIGHIKIENHNQFIHLDQFILGSFNLSTSRLITKVGSGNRGLILYGGSYTIGNNNNRLLSESSSNTIIGNKNYVFNVIGGDNEIGDFNSFITLRTCILNTMGDSNRNIFSISGTNTVFGNFNIDISSLKPNTIEGIATPHNNNIIQDNNSNVIIGGTSNVYNKVSNFTNPDNVTISSCLFDNLSTLTIVNTTGTQTYVSSIFRNISNSTFTNCSFSGASLFKIVTLTLSSTVINNTNLIGLAVVNISNVIVSNSSFENISSSTISLSTGSSIAYSKFEKTSNLTISYLIPAIIGYLKLIDISTATFASTLTGLSNVVINHVTIDNSSDINIIELNNTLSKITIHNCAGLASFYGNIVNTTFFSCINLELISQDPTLNFNNNRVSITDSSFENLNAVVFVPIANDAASVTSHKLSIANSIFKSLLNVQFNTLGRISLVNTIFSCKFENVGYTNFGSVPNNPAASRYMIYNQSEFENIQGVLSTISINTPAISYTSIRNFIADGVIPANITYRSSLVKCKFEKLIIINDTVGGPDYTQFTTLTNFEGSGFFIKNTDTTVSKAGFKANPRITYSASVGINLDSLPSNTYDVNYEVIDSTKLYGIQNVISGGNIVQTPVNLTLI